MTDPAETSACKALWLALIERMILDACGISCTELEHDQAREWLFSPNGDFNVACVLADLEPSSVRARARQLVDASDQGLTLDADKPKKAKRTKLKDMAYTIDGRTMCLVDWIKEASVSTPTVYGRIRRGWSVEAALFTPAIINGKPRGVGRRPAKSAADRSIPSA
ncbi:hypothetical protein J6500_22085 [Bradyrhizobium sp. WSM 1704]|uniref:hypothetical protein n=1 Tax=Bradyrhizobium semiaridum TaxID=2821404 RepID=UPI001CE33BAC|nr:hypothetical protein [Bradyrhizobium semiaridum]MCA6124561.1 hypothetical protein [Bradyrhizobium semiaridum]